VLTETATEAPGRAGDVAVRLLPRAGANVVTFVLGFDAGSRTESAHEHGCAHLLEHLVFRGSEAHPSADAVAAAAEEQGMQIGAHTMHDVVLFHATAPSWSVDAMVDLLCDVVARPLLRDADVEAERAVVSHELARAHDSPGWIAGRLLDRAAFGDHALGRGILGSAASLAAIDGGVVRDFHARRYVSGAAVAVLSGDLERLDRERLAEALARVRTGPAGASGDPAPAFSSRELIERRATGQCRLGLHWRLEPCATGLAQRAAVEVYAALLGGSMGSRLFRAIRVERALAYAVGASAWMHRDATRIDVEVGAAPDRVADVSEAIVAVVEQLAADGPSEAEVRRARAHVVGGTLLALETTSAIARRSAMDHLLFGHAADPASDLAALAAVDVADVTRVARAVAGAPASACVGPPAA